MQDYLDYLSDDDEQNEGELERRVHEIDRASARSLGVDASSVLAVGQPVLSSASPASVLPFSQLPNVQAEPALLEELEGARQGRGTHARSPAPSVSQDIDSS